MTQYISKDAVIAMIKHHIKEERHSYFCKCLLSELDTLEVKEVDLEKELEDWLGERVGKWTGKECERMCRYFFELGLKAQKGE